MRFLRFGLIIFPALAAFAAWPRPAIADDIETCRKQSGTAAIAACSRAISSGRYEGTNLAVLYSNRGAEYKDRGDFGHAIADFDQAIRFDPKFAPAYVYLGNTYKAKGDVARALANYEEAIRLFRKGEILPSRIFAAPGQYPPRQFKAYGIVAFKTRPTAADRSRYDMICDAYVSGLLHYTSVKAPLQQQMVTVWPVDTPALAEKINHEVREKVCADAVPNYGLALAQEAVEAAKRSKAPLDGDGPFLLAWAPGSKQGQADALVLVSDMTDVINNEQAKQIFTRWALDIQENPELWNNGWDEEKLKLVIRLWVDKWGTKILQAIKLKG